MRRAIMHLIAMMITFALGLGIDMALSKKNLVSVNTAHSYSPAPVLPVVETIKEVPPSPSTELEQPNAVLDYDLTKFYPEGGYFMVGPVPKEFNYFQSFSLELSNPVAGREGFVYVATGVKDSFDLTLATFALVTKRRMFWASPPMADGFEYRFDGEFLPVNFEKAALTQTAVLRGTLTKTKNGRKVFEQIVSFSIEYDNC